MIRNLTIFLWNNDKKQTQNVTDLTRKNAVDDMNKREKSGDNLTEKEKKQIIFRENSNTLLLKSFLSNIKNNYGRRSKSSFKAVFVNTSKKTTAFAPSPLI